MTLQVSEEMVALGLGTLNNQDNPDLLRRMKRKEEELELQMKAAFQAQGFQYNPRKNRFPSQSRSRVWVSSTIVVPPDDLNK
jgi:hypothetical protein